MRRFIWGFLFAVLVLGGVGSGGAAETKLERAQKDARILGGVLEELLSEPVGDATIWSGDTDVRGLYFDGYGLLFLVDAGGSHGWFSGHDFTRAASEAKPDSQAVVQELKSRIRSFYTQYGKTAGSLSDGDRITVRINSPEGESSGLRVLEDLDIDLGDVDVDVDVDLGLDDASHGDADTVVVVKRYGIGIEEIQAEVAKAMEEVKEATAHVKKMRFAHQPDAPRLPTLEATATAGDIRKGKDDGDYVSFKAILDSAEGDRSIRIMSGILQSGLSGKATRGLHRYLPWSAEEVSGFHLDGLGAVFFASASGAHRVFEVWEGNARTARKDESAVDAYREEVVSLIAEYGGTLRPVKSGESVTVHVSLGHSGRRSGGPSGLVVRAKKDILDRYAAGKIGLVEVKRSVDVQTY